jgi:hypothetical protein
VGWGGKYSHAKVRNGTGTAALQFPHPFKSTDITSGLVSEENLTDVMGA